MKIALVHDYLVQYGGAERVLECFTEVFPEAPIFTILYDPSSLEGKFSNKKIHTSFLQKTWLARKKHRFFAFLMPLAIEQFNFSPYEIVFSDSSSYAKGIITGPRTLHVCYMHTPMRYAWDDCQKYTRDFSFPGAIKRMIPPAMNYLRLWDKISAERVDFFIANSNFVAKRIRKYYRKEADVIHPPVDTSKFFLSSSPAEDYFLMVGRLIAYKRHDIAIEAFNKLGWKLKIIGQGPEMKRLKKMARPNIEFLGQVSDEELAKYYARCRAFIFPQEEDFGIVAIEAMACGRPIVAYRGGDIPEHLEEGKMGVFFDRQTSADIIEAVKKMRDQDYDSAYIRQKALKFDREIFKAKIKEYIEDKYRQFKSQQLSG